MVLSLFDLRCCIHYLQSLGNLISRAYILFPSEKRSYRSFSDRRYTFTKSLSYILFHEIDTFLLKLITSDEQAEISSNFYHITIDSRTTRFTIVVQYKYIYHVFSLRRRSRSYCKRLSFVDTMLLSITISYLLSVPTNMCTYTDFRFNSQWTRENSSRDYAEKVC